jgi:predicted transcriptional regulator
MNFSIHLDDRLAAALKREATRTRRPRNAIVAEAIRQWMEKSRRSTWPPELTDFEPFTDLERFESHRSKKRTGARFP